MANSSHLILAKNEQNSRISELLKRIIVSIIKTPLSWFRQRRLMNLWVYVYAIY